MERLSARFRICDENDPIHELLLIEAGVVRVSAIEDDGRASLVALRTVGWLIGAAPAILGTRHLACISALTDCTVRRLTVAEFHRLRREDPDVGQWLQEMLAIEAAEQHLRAAAGHSGRKRQVLERVLVELFAAASTPRPDGARRLVVPLGPTELGELVGISRQWADRLLTEMRDDNTLLRERGWLIAPAGSSLLQGVTGR